ncbi:MAG: hypothetical protein GY850_28540 [bacterium]|nr:hypothetical protein [bacterium]
MNWETLITKGFDALVKESWESAERHGTDDAKWFAENAEICCQAVVDFSRKYAKSAKKIAHTAVPENRDNLLRAANALEIVPADPAPDFFSALHGIWIVWMISSGYVGQRDLTFGRMDQYLYPLYKRGVEDGSLTPELATSYLAHLFLKTKEICGLSTDNYNIQPIPCFGSNQYAAIGGRDAEGRVAVNELSYCILKAKTLSDVPQPAINVLVDSDFPKEFKVAVADAVEANPDQIFLKNDKAFVGMLKTSMPHLDRNDLMNYCFWPCNRIDFPGQNYITDGPWFVPMPKIFMDSIHQPEKISSFEDLLDRFKAAFRRKIIDMTNLKFELTAGYDNRRYHYESVLMDGCIEKCKDVLTGGVKYLTQYFNLESIATVADSLMAIKQLVYQEKRFGLDAFMEIVNSNYEGHEPLRLEILHRIPKYGNDIDEVDDLAVLVTDWAFELADELQFQKDRLFFFSIYSEHNHLVHGHRADATPDGRLKGQPFSKDQNPSIGTDTAGITARLKSAAKIAHPKFDGGSLDIRFSKLPPKNILLDLVDTYFNMGGKTIAFNAVSRETLMEAQKHPEEHQTLTVRLTGYSDYFVNISPAIQEDIISKTEY